MVPGTISHFHLGEPSGKQISETLQIWLQNAASTSTSEVACNNHQPSASHAIRLVRMVPPFGHQKNNVQDLVRHRARSAVATFWQIESATRDRYVFYS